MSVLPDGVVTLLFTDVEGSTRLARELGDDFGFVLAEHRRLLREVWSAGQGVEVDAEGDSFLVAFARASDAVTAASAAQRALADHPHLRVRIGVHSGEPRQRDGRYWGIDVHYAARVCNAAHGRQVLLSQSTRTLVPDTAVDSLGEHVLKDFPAPRELFQLRLDGHTPASFPPPRTLTHARTNLPSATTSLVGRESERRQLTSLLSTGARRLVTVTGLGGTGKTRVALAVAAELLEEFDGGVYVVGLAAVPSADGVAGAIAEAIAAPVHGHGPEAAAAARLRDQHTLLVIDNFEHVLEAAPILSRLLAACPEVRILATSQTPLRVSGEAVFPLSSLEETAAIALFDERARAADPGWDPDGSAQVAVAALCRMLEGLPLAIELAAARVRLGGPEALLAALSRGVDALGAGARDLPARQRGIRAALDHTIGLLEPQDRELFAALGVFGDAWTIEQAEALLGDSFDAWAGLAALSDYSLVRTRGDGRMTMAARVGAHARELLVAGGREQELRRRHAEVIAADGERLFPDFLYRNASAIAATRDLWEEVEFAIAWSSRHAPDVHRRLFASFGALMLAIAPTPGLCAAVLALSDAERGEDLTAGRLFHARLGLDWHAGVPDAERVRWAELAVACHRSSGPVQELGYSLFWYAYTLACAGQSLEAQAVITEGVAVADAADSPLLRGLIEEVLIWVAAADGAWEQAELAAGRVVASSERTDFMFLTTSDLWARCAFERGDHDAAIERWADTIRRLRGSEIANALMMSGSLLPCLVALGRDLEAAELYAAASGAYARLGVPGWPREHAAHAEAVRSRLGSARWDALLRRQRDCDPAAAVDLALSIAAARGPRETAGRYSGV